MASRQVLLLAAAAVAATLLPATTTAAQYNVGGDGGWTLNYTIGWPEGKTFKVGDSLVFTYPSDQYNVMEVDGETFKDCYRQGNMFGMWTTGNDTIKLDKPLRRWFFCGVADYCEIGLKLVIQVISNGTDAPPPPAPPTPTPPAPVPPNNPPPAPPSNPPPVTSSSQSSAALKHMVGGVVTQAIVAAGTVVVATFM